MSAKKSDWRKEGQREESRPVMKTVGLTLDILGLVCCIGALGIEYAYFAGMTD